VERTEAEEERAMVGVEEEESVEEGVVDWEEEGGAEVDPVGHLYKRLLCKVYLWCTHH